MLFNQEYSVCNIGMGLEIIEFSEDKAISKISRIASSLTKLPLIEYFQNI